MGRTRIIMAIACLLMAGCGTGPAPELGLSASKAATRNSAIVLGRLAGFHKDPRSSQWIAGAVKLSLTPADSPPFFNDLVFCPGRMALSDPCGWYANGIVLGQAPGQPWSSINTFLLEVPAGTYTVTSIEAKPFVWGVKAGKKNLLPAITLKAGEVVNVGSITAYFATPQTTSQYAGYSRQVSSRFTIVADEPGARAYLAASNPVLAGELVTRLLVLPETDR
jgi:hypothetical protein